MTRVLDERWQRLPRRVWISFTFEGRELSGGELFAAGVSQETVQAPAEMAEMVCDTRGTVRLEPELGSREVAPDPGQVLARLHERVCYWLKVGVHPVNRPSKPRFCHYLAPE